MIVNGFLVFGLNWRSAAIERMNVALVANDDYLVAPRGDLVPDQACNFVAVVPQILVGSEHIDFKEEHENLLVIIRQDPVHVIRVRIVCLRSFEEMFTGGLKELTEPGAIVRYVQQKEIDVACCLRRKLHTLQHCLKSPHCLRISIVCSEILVRLDFISTADIVTQSQQRYSLSYISWSEEDHQRTSYPKDVNALQIDLSWYLGRLLNWWRGGDAHGLFYVWIGGYSLELIYVL